MAVPEIVSTRSIPDPTVGEPFSYILFATNSPTSWSCSLLPAGLSFNTSTGEISGTPTTPGFAVAAVVATNGTGPSSPAFVYLGVAPAMGSELDHLNPALLGFNCLVEITTGEVTFPYWKSSSSPGVSGVSSGAASGVSSDASTPNFLMSFIERTNLLLYVQFTKNGKFVDQGEIVSGNLEFVFKEFEPEGQLVIGNTHIIQGSGQDRTYILYCYLDPAELEGVLSNYEDDRETKFIAPSQLRWAVPNDAGIGPDPLVRLTQPFNIQVVRNLA